MKRLSISITVCILLFVIACSTSSYQGLYKRAESIDKNLVLLLLYQVPSKRIDEILKSQQKQLLLTAEINELAKKNGITANEYRKIQLSRITYANKFYAETTIHGIFTDRGRIYIKYGEPDIKIDSQDDNIGVLQKWTYSSLNKVFIFVQKEHNERYELFNKNEE